MAKKGSSAKIESEFAKVVSRAPKAAEFAGLYRLQGTIFQGEREGTFVLSGVDGLRYELDIAAVERFRVISESSLGIFAELAVSEDAARHAAIHSGAGIPSTPFAMHGLQQATFAPHLMPSPAYFPYTHNMFMQPHPHFWPYPGTVPPGFMF
jgi:hypothetical protein